MNAMLPATIRPEDWFPCEPDEDGSYCLHDGRQYLAAMRFFDGPAEHFEYVVVTVSYPNGYLALETEDAEIEPTEVAFLALLEGGQ